MKTNLNIYLAFCLIAFSLACTKETVIEREIVPERKASALIKDSMSVDSNSQMVISKSSLGKAFILIPSMRSSGQHPDLNYLRPLIISFEKSGSRIALFNLTEEQLYDTIPSEKLLQTFSILSETENSLTIGLGKGFTSFDSKEVFGVLIRDEFVGMLESIQSGKESSLEVKESFIRSAESVNNSIFIEQVMRIKTQTLKEKADPSAPGDKAKPQIATEESTRTFDFEVKPYAPSAKFQSKIYDK